jgi:3-oxoacyl-[acyl-carrier protein] reductase
VDLGITGKIAVVAGGSRGGGRGISDALAAEGARVVLTGRQQAVVENAVNEIAASGGTAYGVVSDMTTITGVDEIIDTTRGVFGDPDILIVNSPSADRPGSTSLRGFDNCADEDYLAMFDSFVLSQVRLARAVLPAMKERRWGRLVNIGSIAFKTPHQEDPLPANDAGRMGITPLMRIIAHEYGMHGVTANTVATGPFNSELSRDYLATNPVVKTAEWYQKMLPVGRWGEPIEMGWLVAFLCSDRAAFLTGEVIRLDGGYTKSLF